ncbi:MAG: phosphoenolpyruvate mutase [Rhodospirillaceae bacterium TMED8]|nr:MAG: phosphoenolpyruvate mutase [Rhodospirillaceae bacterium TMED8]
MQVGQISSEKNKFTILRELLQSPNLEFIMEAHNGLSAKIVEETGFRGIWASGLSMSSALGVRDNNEASWTQILEVLEFMSDTTRIPILVDGDTGWGNFNNMRRAVTKLCQRGVAGICIEDKLFPKTNSFIGDGQPLANRDEFCGKIKAGKDSQLNSDFSIVARIEALISGWGMDEALKRAEAYHAAGADAVLIHSKKAVADEVLQFTREWGGRCPVVIVPTKYFDTPTDDFRAAGVSLAIWANHNLRSAIGAMREVSRRIYRDESISGIEKQVASVADVFEIADSDELVEAESRYLPTDKNALGAIVLAASRGAALGELTIDRPKCMIDVRGQPLLRRLTSIFKNAGIRDITVVRGYKKESINIPCIKTVDNDRFASTGEAASLACAADKIIGATVIAYGDILFRQYYLDQLMELNADIAIAVDALWETRQVRSTGAIRDFVECSRPFSGDYLDDEPVSLIRMANDVEEGYVHGEWIGLSLLSAKGSEYLRQALDDLRVGDSLKYATLLDVFSHMVNYGLDVRVLYVPGQWLDVDDVSDLSAAGRFV